MNPFEPRLSQIQANLTRAINAIPAKAGAIVVEHSNEAFQSGGFTNNSFDPWKPRQSENKKDVGRAILVQSGRLRRSIRVVSMTYDTVTIGTDVPYAQVHNEGFTGTVRIAGHIRMANVRIKPITGQKGSYSLKKQKQVVTKHKKYMRMPRRKFLGDSHQQRMKITEMIKKDILKALTIF